MINKCLEKHDSQPILAILQSPKFGLRVVPECAETYYKNLLEAKNLKIKEGKTKSLQYCRGIERLVQYVDI